MVSHMKKLVVKVQGKLSNCKNMCEGWSIISERRNPEYFQYSEEMDL